MDNPVSFVLKVLIFLGLWMLGILAKWPFLTHSSWQSILLIHLVRIRVIIVVQLVEEVVVESKELVARVSVVSVVRLVVVSFKAN